MRQEWWAYPDELESECQKLEANGWAIVGVSPNMGDGSALILNIEREGPDFETEGMVLYDSTSPSSA